MGLDRHLWKGQEMARFSFRPALTLKGRKFFGLRGFAGKPFHPPLTDVPIGAYVLAAAFDLISWIWHEQSWAREFFRAGTFVLVGGAFVSLATALTGYMDWRKSVPKSTPGPQNRERACDQDDRGDGASADRHLDATGRKR
jgi:predicted membrane protein DUF2231